LHGRQRRGSRFHGGRLTQLEYTLHNNTVRRTQIYIRKEGLDTTSEERKEARYQRRKAARQAKRDALSEACGNFEEVFTFEHLYDSAKNCSKGVMWKNSVQNYMSRITTNVADTHEKLMNGKFRSRGFHEFDLIERGKLRHIKSVHISERVVQRCLCDYILVKVFSNSFIHDNAASLKGKGIDFAMDRVNTHLHRFYRQHGVSGLMNGAVLMGDSSDFFNSSPHDIIYVEGERRIKDERIRKLANGFMEDFGDRGFGLGSQVSQIDSLMVASPLDHFIKEKLRIKHYGRYMDDFYLIHEDPEYLAYCMEEIKKKCDELGLNLNKKKTRIIPLRNGFRFLKTKFVLTETGAVIRKMNRSSPTRMRRKLKTFKRWMEEGKFTIDDVNTAYQSWRGHMRRGNSTKILRRMDKFFNELFLETEEVRKSA